MKNWYWITLVLCALGLFKEFRPSEPYVTEFLIEYKNITSDVVIHSIFPISTYTILTTLVLIFLITDFLRYQPILIVQGLSYVLTWIFLIWGQSLLSLQATQIFYGIGCSADVAYYTYIYAQVEPKHYRKVTSYTYTATFTAKFLGGSLSQFLISFHLMNILELNFISLGSVLIAFLLSMLLPIPDKSVYFHYEEKTGEEDDASRRNLLGSIQGAYPKILKDCADAYSNPNVLKWSIWLAIATAGNLQVQNYIQALWKVIGESNDGEREKHLIYNGAVNSVQCLLCALFSFGVGQLSVNWSKSGERFLSIISILQCAVIFWLSQTESIILGYSTFVCFRVLYQFVITIANSEIVQGINKNSYGLIFGLNNFGALVIQTIITLIISDDKGLALNERDQFTVYSFYFGVLALGFLLVSIYKYCSLKNQVQETDTDKVKYLCC